MKFFDLHSDTPYECYTKNLGLYGDGLAVSLENAACFDEWQQVFAIWIPDKEQNPYLLYRRILEDFTQKLNRVPENFTYSLSVEGGRVIERNINRLYEIYNDGVKLLTLTWNGENAIAGGCKSEGTLTRFGRAVIREMNNIGMVCDVSHLNDKSFYKVIDIADRVIASHSLCRACFDHKRNLTNEQLRLIAQKNGIIGVCFYPAFLGGDTFEKLYGHISHMLSLGLEDNIAIGSDFDGADMDTRLMSVKDIPGLYFKLSEMGLSDRVLNKIFYENAKRYMLTL